MIDKMNNSKVAIKLKGKDKWIDGYSYNFDASEILDITIGSKKYRTKNVDVFFNLNDVINILEYRKSKKELLVKCGASWFYVDIDGLYIDHNYETKVCGEEIMNIPCEYMYEYIQKKINEVLGNENNDLQQCQDKNKNLSILKSNISELIESNKRQNKLLEQILKEI